MMSRVGSSSEEALATMSKQEMQPRRSPEHLRPLVPRSAPVKPAPWEPYLPVYFWLGGIAAGGWLAATAEDWFGAADRGVVGAGRYLAAGGVLAGTPLLIIDLGRPDRFHKMLRLVKPRSAMSLGSWGIAAFGAIASGAAILQFIEARVGPTSDIARISRGTFGRSLHLVGLPLALFVGSYTGVLLAATSTPAWARRRFTLPSLFLASGVASGLAATAALVTNRSSISDSARRHLARAGQAVLAAELALNLADELAASPLPSRRAAPAAGRVGLALSLLAGTVAPLLLLRSGGRRRQAPKSALLAAALTLGGSLALRFRIVGEGYHSAETPADTWAVAQGRRLVEERPRSSAEETAGEALTLAKSSDRPILLGTRS